MLIFVIYSKIIEIGEQIAVPYSFKCRFPELESKCKEKIRFRISYWLIRVLTRCEKIYMRLGKQRLSATRLNESRSIVVSNFYSCQIT